ncbi:DNA polymerase III subunit beta [Salinactinospora qingdaonensis]|uniref:DNA polymerase III subunit beta n=1 Tax=Salinactinospora qingdaonensis TaxID=702744 RepID=A0ABP7F981_9ACTN
MFTTTVGELRGALATAGIAQDRSPHTPTLAGVLLDTRSGALTITGCNYQAAITVALPQADVDTEERVVVDHLALSKLLSAVTKQMPKRTAEAKPVSLTVDDGKALISAAGYTVPSLTLPVEDYPNLPTPAPPTVWVDRRQFTTELARVLVTTSTDHSLPVLTGVWTEVDSHSLTMAATDRYRIARTHLPTTTGTTGPVVTGVLPGQILDKTTRRFTHDTIGIGATQSEPEHGLGSLAWVTLTCGNVALSLHLIDDEFPELLDKFPATFATTVTADRTELATLVERAAAINTAHGHRRLPVRLSVAESSVTVTPDEATLTPHIPAKTTGVGADKAGIQVAFNPNYLSDALETIPGDTVTLHINKPTTPVVITTGAAQHDDPTTYRHLLAPVRL